MAQNGFYAYNPANYHGPLHFYVLFVSLKLLGRSLWALRIPVVLASLLTIYWMFLFRPFLGRTICYLAALGMALSPGFIFYNRYSIHESWMVLFLTITCWGILGIWSLREARYFWGFILGVTGMILTKETYVIHLAAFGGAACVSLIWNKFSKDKESRQATESLPIKHIAGAVVVGIILIVFFYSGNFLYWRGLKGLYEAFLPWTKTGIDSAGHGKPTFDLCPLIPPFLENLSWLRGLAGLKLNWYWVRLLLGYEWFALAGLIFSLRFLFGGRLALRFLALYGLVVLFAYSIVPYKTPWCIISIAWPFLFLAGALIEFLAKQIHPIAASVVGIPLLAQACWKSYDLNFVRYDDPREMYVYVQTVRDYHKFIDPILEKAAKDPSAQRKLSGGIYLSSYYPIPWVLGDFSRIAYYNKEDLWPQNCDADFLAVDADNAGELEKHLKDRYFTVDFQLRDGMGDCRGYFRFETFRDIFPSREPDFGPAHPDE